MIIINDCNNNKTYLVKELRVFTIDYDFFEKLTLDDMDNIPPDFPIEIEIYFRDQSDAVHSVMINKNLKKSTIIIDEVKYDYDFIYHNQERMKAIMDQEITKQVIDKL